MTDKEKIRKEIEKLKSNLIHGACASQIAMETRCKEEAYDEVISLLDSLQEESVSEELEEEALVYSASDTITEDGKLVIDSEKVNAFKAGANWQKEKHEQQFLFINLKDCKDAYHEWKSTQKEPISVALSWVRACQWQKEQMMKDAVNGLVYAQRTNGEVMFRSNYVKKEGFEFGDKVKVIVIKED